MSLPARFPSFEIQPITFAMTNGWDSYAYLILEFVASGVLNKNVNEFFNARKLVDLRAPHARRRTADDGIRRRITMGKFIRRNHIDAPAATVALHYLEDMVLAGKSAPVTERFVASIEKLTVAEVSR